MDLWLFQTIHSVAGLSPALDVLIVLLASPFAYVLGAVMVLALVVPQYFGFSVARNAARMVVAGAVLSAFIGRFVIKEAVVLVYDIPRPFAIVHDVTPLISHDSMASFPSGHAVFFFAAATVILLYNRWLGTALLVASAGMVLARVAAGIHWPSDVLAGASIGVLIGLLMGVALRRYYQKDRR